MTEGLFPEPVRVRPKERGGRWGHASPFMRGSTIVRSQTFSPGARSQYVCRVSLLQTYEKEHFYCLPDVRSEWTAGCCRRCLLTRVVVD